MEKTSYALGNETFFTSFLKTPVLFLGESWRLFISSCFRFFMLSFLQMSLLFTSLFLHCLCCYHKCYRFETATFTPRHFLPNTPFLLLSGLPWAWQFILEGCRPFYWGLKRRPNPSICFNHTVFGSYMISMELYLNFSKYVNKLLVVESFINF